MKTQRVRIYCLIDPDGMWDSTGWKDAKDEHMQSSVRENFTGNHEEARGVWIEADVPIPEVPTVEGRVVE